MAPRLYQSAHHFKRMQETHVPVTPWPHDSLHHSRFVYIRVAWFIFSLSSLFIFKMPEFQSVLFEHQLPLSHTVWCFIRIVLTHFFTVSLRFWFVLHILNAFPQTLNSASFILQQTIEPHHSDHSRLSCIVLSRWTGRLCQIAFIVKPLMLCLMKNKTVERDDWSQDRCEGEVIYQDVFPIKDTLIDWEQISVSSADVSKCRFLNTWTICSLFLVSWQFSKFFQFTFVCLMASRLHVQHFC